jgi:septum formation protein
LDSVPFFIPEDDFFQERHRFFSSQGLRVQAFPVPKIMGLVLLEHSPRDFLHQWVQDVCKSLDGSQGTCVVIHTAIFCGRRCLGMPRSQDEAQAMIKLLSGRRHRLYTVFGFWHPERPVCKPHVVLTHVKVKQLALGEVSDLKQAFPLYPLHPLFESKIESVIGSPGNLRGIPALELMHHLRGKGLLHES